MKWAFWFRTVNREQNRKTPCVTAVHTREYDSGTPAVTRLGTVSPAGGNRSQGHLCPEAIWFQLQRLGRGRTLTVGEIRMQLSTLSEGIAQGKGLVRKPENHDAHRVGPLLQQGSRQNRIKRFPVRFPLTEMPHASSPGTSWSNLELTGRPAFTPAKTRYAKRAEPASPPSN